MDAVVLREQLESLKKDFQATQTRLLEINGALKVVQYLLEREKETERSPEKTTA